MRRWLLLTCLCLSGCEPGFPDLSSDSTTTTDSLVPKTATIHEYWRRGRTHHSTGRFLSFRFPAAYYYSSQDVDGRASVMSVAIRWNAVTRGPITASEERRLPHYVKAMAINVYLSHFSRVQRPLTLEELRWGRGLILRVRGAQTVVRPRLGEMPPYRSLDEHFCGFELFDIDPPEWPQVTYKRAIAQDAREVLAPPFNRARLFARKNTAGLYETIVVCSESPPLAYCGIATDYRGWPMQIYFSGNHLCELDTLLARSRRLLEDHLVATSGRTQGVPDHDELTPEILERSGDDHQTSQTGR